MIRLLQGDCREVLATLPEESVHCVVTSPPYWSLRDYGVDGQLGLEATIEEHIEAMVDVFRSVRRVLRDDGVCWVNLGDTFIGAPHGHAGTKSTLDGRSPEVLEERSRALRTHSKRGAGLKPKDLVGMPWRIALALQADGWWLRSDIVWHKPNPQPEAVLDRPTRSHEFVFLLSKSEVYFYDAEAIREVTSGGAHSRGGGVHPKAVAGANYIVDDAGGRLIKDHARDAMGLRPGSRFGRSPGWRSKQNESYAGAVRHIVQRRNARSVWTIPTHPFSEAHFATFPPELAERCILAGTSAMGACHKCGSPIERRVSTSTSTDGRPHLGTREPHEGRIDATNRQKTPPSGIISDHETVAWATRCRCRGAGARPCVVLDPFGGAGTTGLVARNLGRDSILVELNPEYIEIARRRLFADQPLMAGGVTS